MMLDGVVSRLAVRSMRCASTWGRSRGYFADRLGIDAAARDELKAVFLQ
jgi:hypothetical protein